MNKKINFDFAKGNKTPQKSILIGGLAVLSIFYMINPTAGFFEFLPDNLPFIGNIDEFMVGMVLLNCLKYFDIDLMSFFSGDKKDIIPNKPTSEPVYQAPDQK